MGQSSSSTPPSTLTSASTHTRAHIQGQMHPSLETPRPQPRYPPGAAREYRNIADHLPVGPDKFAYVPSATYRGMLRHLAEAADLSEQNLRLQMERQSMQKIIDDCQKQQLLVVESHPMLERVADMRTKEHRLQQQISHCVGEACHLMDQTDTLPPPLFTPFTQPHLAPSSSSRHPSPHHPTRPPLHTPPDTTPANVLAQVDAFADKIAPVVKKMAAEHPEETAEQITQRAVQQAAETRVLQNHKELLGAKVKAEQMLDQALQAKEKAKQKTMREASHVLQHAQAHPGRVDGAEVAELEQTVASAQWVIEADALVHVAEKAVAQAKADIQAAADFTDNARISAEMICGSARQRFQVLSETVAHLQQVIVANVNLTITKSAQELMTKAETEMNLIKTKCDILETIAHSTSSHV